MTDYLTYTPAEYAPDAPATALHFQRWFENWIAGFEGAAGAPKLWGAAMYSTFAGVTVQRDCLPFGGANLAASSSTINQTNTSDNPVSAFTALVPCTVRVFLSGTVAASGGGSGGFRVRKNNAVVQTWTGSQTNVSVDVSLAAGDCIAVQSFATVSLTTGSATATPTSLKYGFNIRSAVMT